MAVEAMAVVFKLQADRRIRTCPERICVRPGDKFNFELENHHARHVRFRAYGFTRIDCDSGEQMEPLNPFGFDPTTPVYNGYAKVYKTRIKEAMLSGPGRLCIKYSVRFYDLQTGEVVDTLDPEIEIERDVTLHRPFQPGLLVGIVVSAIGIALLVKESLGGRSATAKLERRQALRQST
jgi:hypothetical protein